MVNEDEGLDRTTFEQIKTSQSSVNDASQSQFEHEYVDEVEQS